MSDLLPKIPKILPKVGTLYKVRGGNLAVLEDALTVWKEVSPDQFVEYHFSPDDPTTILLTDVIEIPRNTSQISVDSEEDDFEDKVNKESFRFHAQGTKHSCMFLIGDKKIATAPFYLPLFDIFFEKQEAKKRKKRNSKISV